MKHKSLSLCQRIKKWKKQGLNPQPSAWQAMMLTTRPERMDETCDQKSLSDQAHTHMHARTPARTLACQTREDG